MIDWDKPYGEHFGGNGPARFTQDGTDYNAAGYELDADGTVVEGVANEPPETGAKRGKNPVNTGGSAGQAPAPRPANPAPADYTSLKTDIGEEAYAALGKEDKRAGALQKRAERLN